MTEQTPRRRPASRHRRRGGCDRVLQKGAGRDRNDAPAGRGRKAADACRDHRRTARASIVMDDFPEYREQCSGGKIVGPKTAGASTFVLHLNVPNCDEAVKRATDAGATILMPPMDAFWGDRYGQVLDPFGHAWSFAHPLPKA